MDQFSHPVSGRGPHCQMASFGREPEAVHVQKSESISGILRATIIVKPR